MPKLVADSQHKNRPIDGRGEKMHSMGGEKWRQCGPLLAQFSTFDQVKVLMSAKL
jgi:hypothetical protein